MDLRQENSLSLMDSDRYHGTFPVDLAKTSLDAGIKLAKGETVDKEAQVEMWMINSDNIKDYDLESWD